MITLKIQFGETLIRYLIENLCSNRISLIQNDQLLILFFNAIICIDLVFKFNLNLVLESFEI